MFLSQKKTIEDKILEVLRRGSLKTTDLLKLIPATKQGVYRVLRLLKEEEVIVIHNKKVSLNIRWLNELDNFLNLAQHRVGHFASLQEGEKIKYTFNNLNLADAFWGQVIYTLLKTEKIKYFYLYNPHWWFILIRQKQERSLINFAVENNILFLMTVGSKNEMDRAVTREVDGKMSQYSMLDKPMFKKNNYYLNLIGDFLIEVYFDRKVAEEIENWYNGDQSKIERLREIVAKKGKTRLVISHDKKKAERLRKRLRKNFYLFKI